MPFAEELLRECLSAFPHVRLTVTGRCMEPALRHGERVHLVGARRRRPRVGDVVLARQKDGLRLHRLVWGPPLACSGGAVADEGRPRPPPRPAARGRGRARVGRRRSRAGRGRGRGARAARSRSLAGAIAARLRLGDRRARGGAAVSRRLAEAWSRSGRMVGRRIGDEYVLVPLAGARGRPRLDPQPQPRGHLRLGAARRTSGRAPRIVDAVVERFEVDRERAERDTLELLDTLLELAAIVPAAPGGR